MLFRHTCRIIAGGGKGQVQSLVAPAERSHHATASPDCYLVKTGAGRSFDRRYHVNFRHNVGSFGMGNDLLPSRCLASGASFCRCFIRLQTSKKRHHPTNVLDQITAFSRAIAKHARFHVPRALFSALLLPPLGCEVPCRRIWLVASSNRANTRELSGDPTVGFFIPLPIQSIGTSSA
ncbi:hypothetical protein ACRALDRAFT_212938 [Sodiomyces alcalophilus JCM 7366]|uniref:uncharacterized protein n=1 Tax=Sodiomyces alcalophilus JCM 7366 TaxID=591952 RepID=UPI0039B63820